jgi:sulfate/thiosulfate transport system permease protein
VTGSGTTTAGRLVPPTAVKPWGRWGLRVAAIGYIALMIVVPLSAVLANGFAEGLAVFWADITAPIAVEALKLTLFVAILMTAVNAVMGTLTAYVLVRYEFPGRALLNAIVDLPFAIPTLVTGVMLVVLYGPQRLLGAWLAAQGIKVIFATPGIVLALLFVTYPFVVRTVQPLLMGAELKQEEASLTLGATKWQTFRYVLLPTIAPAVITGSILSFARSLGEFGSIVIVAGNIPNLTLTAPVYIFGQIESQNQRGASAVSTLLLALSFSLLLAIDWLQSRRNKRHAG